MAKFKDICSKIGSGATPKGGKEAYCEDGISLIRSQNVLDFAFSAGGLAYINELQAEKLKNVIVEEEDVLLNITGDSVARACIVDKKYLPARVNQHVCIIRADSSKAIPSYLLYYLQLNKKYLLQLASGGATRNALTKDMINNLELELPTIEEQQKVVAVLDDIQKKIDFNNAINENLEQQAQALFKSWFLNYEPWEGMAPNSWLHGKLGDYANIKRGGSPRPIQEYLSDSGLRWLKISDVTGLQTPFIIDIKDHIIEEGLKKTAFLKAGSLVLSNSATPGIPKILDVDSCIHDGWLYFPESKFSNEYLYLYFKYIRQQLVNLSNGSVFNNLKTDILKGYPTILPDEETLQRFDGIIKPMFLQMQNLTRESHDLMDLRDTILPRLMSGELDVSNLDL